MALSHICHFDDDDWSHPDRVAIQVERLRTSGKAFTGFSRMYFYNQDGSAFMMTGGAFGTSQCYLRSFWEYHRFPEIQTTEDVLFAQSAEAEGVADLISGEGLMVARRHGKNTWDNINILDLRRCTPVYISSLPRGFLDALGIPIDPEYVPGSFPPPLIHKSYGITPAR